MESSFYHSNANPKAIVGIARVCTEAYPDPTQFDKKSKYFDARAKKEKPYWYMVDIEFVIKLEEPITLEFLRGVSDARGHGTLEEGPETIRSESYA